MKFLTTHRNALIVIGIVVVLFVALRMLKKRRDEGFQAMMVGPSPVTVRRPGMVPRAPPPGVSPQETAAIETCRMKNDPEKFKSLMNRLQNIRGGVMNPTSRTRAYADLDSFILQIKVKECKDLAEGFKAKLNREFP
jgi:hypothetical protein